MWGTELRFIFAGILVVGFWAGVIFLFIGDWQEAIVTWLATIVASAVVQIFIPPKEVKDEDFK